MSEPIVVGVTGASGAVYARRLLQTLRDAGRATHLTISPSGAAVISQELGLELNLDRPDLDAFVQRDVDDSQLIYHRHDNFMAPIASGSFLTAGMVVCPCSGGTLAAVATSAGGNLIQRAAEVHLKERRKLILTTRETPLSLPHLENLTAACRAGAVILPASPGWYHGVRGLEDLVDFIVARILDQLGEPHGLMRRWGEAEGDASAAEGGATGERRDV